MSEGPQVSHSCSNQLACIALSCRNNTLLLPNEGAGRWLYPCYWSARHTIARISLSATSEEREKKKISPYHIDENHSCWLHSVGHRDGDEPAQSDESPEEAGQVTSHLVSHGEWFLHGVAVHKPRILALQERPDLLT